MAIEIVVDFTDEQWELIKEYMRCYVPKFNDDGEFLEVETLTPTEELMAQRFKQEVKEHVNNTHKREMIKLTNMDSEDIFIL